MNKILQAFAIGVLVFSAGYAESAAAATIPASDCNTPALIYSTDWMPGGPYGTYGGSPNSSSGGPTVRMIGQRIYSSLSRPLPVKRPDGTWGDINSVFGNNSAFLVLCQPYQSCASRNSSGPCDSSCDYLGSEFCRCQHFSYAAVGNGCSPLPGDPITSGWCDIRVGKADIIGDGARYPNQEAGGYAAVHDAWFQWQWDPRFGGGTTSVRGPSDGTPKDGYGIFGNASTINTPYWNPLFPVGFRLTMRASSSSAKCVARNFSPCSKASDDEYEMKDTQNLNQGSTGSGYTEKGYCGYRAECPGGLSGLPCWGPTKGALTPDVCKDPLKVISGNYDEELMCYYSCDGYKATPDIFLNGDPAYNYGFPPGVRFADVSVKTVGQGCPASPPPGSVYTADGSDGLLNCATPYLFEIDRYTSLNGTQMIYPAPASCSTGGGKTACCATGPGTPTCTGVGGIPSSTEVAEPTKCTTGKTACCATGPGTPACTGVGGIPSSTEIEDATKCTKTACCATGPGSPKCTGVGGIPSLAEVADATKCSPTVPCCATGFGSPQCTGVGGAPDLTKFEVADSTKCTPLIGCCATGDGNPKCSGVAGLPLLGIEVEDISKCRKKCCETPPGSVLCSGPGGLAGIGEVPDSSLCTAATKFPCCATGPGKPSCTGVGGIPSATEVADITKCTAPIDWLKHQCGNQTGYTNSVLPPNLPSGVTSFSQLANPMAACCWNGWSQDGANATEKAALAKLDCIERKVAKGESFEAFYNEGSTAFANASAGVKYPNRLFMLNSNGVPINGFYNNKGDRCNYVTSTGATTTKTATQQMALFDTALSNMKNGVTPLIPAGNVPDSCCNLLVLGLERTCPSSSPPGLDPEWRASYTIPGTGAGTGVITRCTAASELKVQYAMYDLCDTKKKARTRFHGVTSIDGNANTDFFPVAAQELSTIIQKSFPTLAPKTCPKYFTWVPTAGSGTGSASGSGTGSGSTSTSGSCVMKK